jgi:hypothetical protein
MNAKAQVLPLFSLKQLADTIFLDTPFPDNKGGNLKHFFPVNVNVRVSAVFEVMGVIKPLWGGAGVESIWNKFWSTLFRRNGQEPRILWFYSAGHAHSPP